MGGVKVLVCGGRNYEDRKFLRRKLDELNSELGIGAIIEGDATGADRFAGEWAAHQGICNIKVRPQWHRLGRKAGPIRNSWMLTYCQPDYVVAFAGGIGTDDMVKQSTRAGVRVIDYRPTPSKAAPVAPPQSQSPPEAS